mmetsp:Transcript_1869/g.7004  ORF Transcript_1869/g.7004 Transcript_1869/m.7004 type:complete len:421 (-) Transcript_1869:3584-4846(-)
MVIRNGILRSVSQSSSTWKKELAARSKPSPSFSKDGTKYSSKLANALARLDELVDWERSHRSVGDNRLMRVSSSPCRDLLEKLGSPQKKLRTVHVTGSKGKGSVVALIALALKEEGFRTGCFCSPHVSRVNERVLIDLEECDDDLLAKSLENVLDVRAKLELHSSTWFDSLAAAGLALLAEEKVDWAIVEVGLGGRLDSTNVLDSELCVITNIMLEHQAIIGPGRREIAYEKAGIIRNRGCSVITGVQPSDSEVVEQIMKCAADAQALEPVFVPSLKPSESFTEVNARIAATTLEEMGRRGVVSKRTGVALSGALINDDLRNRASKVLKGRMELFEYKGVPVVIDGAHVPESVKAAVSEAHLRNYAIGPQVLLIAVGSDKDEKAIASKAIEAQVPFHRIVTTRIGKSSRYTSSAQVNTVH